MPGLDLLEDRTLLSRGTAIPLADNELVGSLVKRLGPLVQVSSLSPFADSTADNVPGQPGTNFLNTEVEPSMTVDPSNPRHLVGAWQQDRWSNGGARDIVTGVSYDGGRTWTIVPVPGATLVAGGVYQRASDPWVSFAPDGGVYLAVYAFNANSSNEAMLVYKSFDGGLTWGSPTTILFDSATNVADDKESVTADPNDPNFAYYTWDRLFFDPTTFAFINGPAYFSRTTDGGMTWEPARVIFGDIPNTQTIGNQIVVTPDGTLLDVFTFFTASSTTIEVVRSIDHGATWSAPITVAAEQPIGVADPGNRVPLRTGTNLPAIAVDPHSGTLYIVWEDGRFSSFAHDSIALSLSKDGGLTWSAPIQVNQTPSSIPRGMQQAFTASVAVAANGNVAVTYYDLRNPENQSGGLPTDYWMVFGRGSQELTNPSNWGSEQRLTNASFNMELAPIARGYFVGDYMALSAGGESPNSFAALFGQTVSPSDQASIFFRDPPLNEPHPAIRQGVDQQPPSGAASDPSALAIRLVDGVNSHSNLAASQWLMATLPALLTPGDVARLDQFFVSEQGTDAPRPSRRSEPEPSPVSWPRLTRLFIPDGDEIGSLTTPLDNTEMEQLPLWAGHRYNGHGFRE